MELGRHGRLGVLVASFAAEVGRTELGSVTDLSMMERIVLDLGMIRSPATLILVQVCDFVSSRVRLHQEKRSLLSFANRRVTTCYPIFANLSELYFCNQ